MWKDFLAFSKKQKQGFWILMILFFIFSFFVIYPVTDKGSIDIIFLKSGGENSTSGFSKHDEPRTDDRSLFAFDPNTATISQLQQLGFSNAAIINLRKYIEAGGRIKASIDLRKVYGVDSVQYARIADYVSVDMSEIHPMPERRRLGGRDRMVDFNNASSADLRSLSVSDEVIDSIKKLKGHYWFAKKFDFPQFSGYSPDKQMRLVKSCLIKKQNQLAAKSDFKIELNSADTSELKLLKGIGSVLSKRIVSYRSKIGGYISIDQLKEVYGISPVTIDQIKGFIVIDTLRVSPLSVNTSSLRRLKEHPYVGFYKAKDIVEYRNKHGKIEDLAEVFQLQSFDNADINLIKHYLAL